MIASVHVPDLFLLSYLETINVHMCQALFLATLAAIYIGDDSDHVEDVDHIDNNFDRVEEP